MIGLDDHRPEEHFDQVLAGIRTRLAHDPDLERSVSAEELRRVARGRITRLLAGPDPGAPGAPPGSPGPPPPAVPGQSASGSGHSAGRSARSGGSGRSGSPSVAV